MESTAAYKQQLLLQQKSSDMGQKVGSCGAEGRDSNTVVASLNGALLREADPFPYYMLVAFEAGGYLRAILVLLSVPVYSFLSRFVSRAAAIQLLIFVSLAGLKVERIESVARAVLPKFFREDIHSQTWTEFCTFGTRYLLTSTPRIMAQTFAKEFLGVNEVFGTELEVTKGGRATGFLQKPGVLVGRNKADVLREMLGSETPYFGVGHGLTDYFFVCLCKIAVEARSPRLDKLALIMYYRWVLLCMPDVQEAYIVKENEVEECSNKELPKTLVFHDGRFVHRPTRLVALFTILWMPIGFVLAWLRLSVGIFPFPIALALVRLLGVQVKVNGTPPAAASNYESGVLFVSNHRTLLDPVFLSLALGRRVPALTFSISRLTEMVSPIKTVRMTRDREKDAQLIKELLALGDLCVCPEGTTCRERFLLRFSAMFAELTNEIVPVATNTKQSMFNGTTATGWKGMDLFFFFMNPAPVYEITFLQKLPPHLTCASGKSSHEVANYIQQEIARTLRFKCTNFTRRDKYRILAGTDGGVKSK